MMSEGQMVPGGTELKKGFDHAVGSSLMKAACPMYCATTLA